MWLDERFSVSITDRERTLLDLFALPRMFGGLAESLAALDRACDEIDVEKLVEYAIRYDSLAVAKRLGWSLEAIGTNSSMLTRLLDLRVSHYSPLDPGRARRGRHDRRWKDASLFERTRIVAWRIFRRHRSGDSLDGLLAVVGEDRRKAVIEGEVDAILEEDALSLSDAEFLVEVGRIDQAEDYLLDRADRLDGDRYWILLPLAETMEAEGRLLAASVVYRALIASILGKARSKTYPHAVRYLKALDRLAPSVSGWRDFEDHSAYSERLRREHGRKSSFWSRYA